VPGLLAAQDTTHAAPAADTASARTPFAFADFTWLQGNPRGHQSVLD
jgi:hypothetical protein